MNLSTLRPRLRYLVLLLVLSAVVLISVVSFVVVQGHGQLAIFIGLLLTLGILGYLALTVRRAEQIETVVAERTAELSKEVAERKRLERVKDEFVSMVSHELRTPLVVIEQSVSIVLEGIVGSTNEQQRKLLSIASEHLKRLAELINSILDLSKIEAGKFVLHRRETDLGELVQQSCTAFQVSAGSRRIVAHTPQVPPVFADPDRMMQVLANLLNNAIKFTPADGLITVTLDSQGNRIACSVSDTGPGIPADQQGRLFEKFHQLRDSLSDRPRGTGLGLAICKQLVELHGGTIAVQSTVGQGSTFTFTVPAFRPVVVFAELFKETAARATGEGGGAFGVVAVDLADVRARLTPASSGSWEEAGRHCIEAVRKSLQEDDHVLLVEETTLAVLAIAGRAGIEVIRHRLRGVCAAWVESVLAAAGSPAIRIGSAVYPYDGQQPEALLRYAKERWAEAEQPLPPHAGR